MRPVFKLFSVCVALAMMLRARRWHRKRSLLREAAISFVLYFRLLPPRDSVSKQLGALIKECTSASIANEQALTALAWAAVRSRSATCLSNEANGRARAESKVKAAGLVNGIERAAILIGSGSGAG